MRSLTSIGKITIWLCFTLSKQCNCLLKLLNDKGYFERTQSLRKLLLEFQDKESVKEFLEKYKKVLRNLERAYVSSRYYFEEFFEDEVVEALEELRNLLWKE
ncbi:MAG: HEPN domain-containing protein [Archaeoglobaceae archaeon]|nr:HEPN domain-containing protein [Archaeoglobaceae archaeon]MCX8151875.1 HEPN domain-containing protein [Archaeoglobaceae archaeon]MDW8014293.1 HEPN domain-containing protein [Archaeoglobaceae archaeon]